mmetsp:Transcript_1344/g.5117  ORF Transcript_1344/g.5117 Transcript_1344/m.5117 type:complete len:219 (-) Transcript_1344:351-1007(-)
MRAACSALAFESASAATPCQPDTCSLRLHTSNGYATVCPIAPAMPPQTKPVPTSSSFALCKPYTSTAMASFRVPYTAKFKPTYGMTPITLGSHPLYSALTPSSWTITLAACDMFRYCVSPVPSTCTVRRPRNMSSGYVADIAKMPAPAPAHSRVSGPSFASGSLFRFLASSAPSKYSYARNLDALFGTIRIQLAPFPLNIPLMPSLFQMCDKPFHTPL